MFRLLLRLILFPVYLLLVFVSLFTTIISNIGNIVMGLFYLYVFAVFVLVIVEHAWIQLAIVAAISFGVFLLHFGALAALEGVETLKEKLLDVMYC